MQLVARPLGNQRYNYAKTKSILEVPNLIESQRKSFEKFIQRGTLPEQRKDEGLQGVFNSVLPIFDFNNTVSLEFVNYEIGVSLECRCGALKVVEGKQGRCKKCGTEIARQFKEKYSPEECLEKGLTYAAPLKVTMRLVLYEKDKDAEFRKIKELREQDVYLGEFPLMTPKGSFIINGTERVVVSQMNRSPGIFFKIERPRDTAVGKSVFSARITPYRGSWVEFEFDIKELLYVRIDKKRKIPVTTLLRALGFTEDAEILNLGIDPDNPYFYENRVIRIDRQNKKFYTKISNHLLGAKLSKDLYNKEGTEIIQKAGRKIKKAALTRMRDKESGIDEIETYATDLVSTVAAEDIVDPDTGEILVECNEDLTPDQIEKIYKSSIESFKILILENSPIGRSLRETLLRDPIKTTEDAQMEIYRRLRPGDLPTKEGAKIFFQNLFFNPTRYDLSKVGRLKINSKLGFEDSLEDRILKKRDFLATIRYLCQLTQGIGTSDDVDHLGNRRVRSVGELIENQFRIGLVRMERLVKERMSIQDLTSAMPHDLINAKPVTAAIKEFFGSSQLSQFMDQTNPLAELTHKRRLSALGPGGLSRERAGFEVRDVHATHYGRICPIETPEGPNIGLIASLSTYAKISDFGFIETPYRKVIESRVTDEIVYLNALEEEHYVIAQANAPMDKNNYLAANRISARSAGNFVMIPPKEINYMDVSPRQLVSVATSLIPFLEHDDANRALMGSNMQRQALPLLRTEEPLIGTGMESIVARDSGAIIPAKRTGTVISVSTDRIIIRAEEKDAQLDNTQSYGAPVDLYELPKFQRSNQNTCINFRPIVKKGDFVLKDQVIADGPAVCHGELALGHNLLVAFMPWGGYNFEDAILISEKLIKDDIYTSVHIEEFEIEAKDTKLGPEEITRDIPNVSEEALHSLDESGIVKIGSSVKPGDVLVGKVTPKGETQLSPEEKLLRAIFGDKAGDVRDASLVTPPWIEGTVIDVKIFSRRGVEKDARAESIETERITKIEQNHNDMSKTVEDQTAQLIMQLFADQKITAKILTNLIDDKEALKNIKEKKDIQGREELIKKIPQNKYRKLASLLGKEVEDKYLALKKSCDEALFSIRTDLEDRIDRLKKSDELRPGVSKLVKVYLAIKRRLSVGDKMAGRHGNKGVIARILPEEDMPYLEDGTPTEIVLNPLGVPSRMNVGQILETHLGWAAKVLDMKIATPVFEGAVESEIKDLLSQANLPDSGQTTLYDGRTGKPFDQKVTVGYIYMMKLVHLVDDKIHARSIGPYSLVTQQPLGGKAQMGGQRFGEMEVWALEAYGAAHTLQEILTVKSDDVQGRTKIYESIVKGDNMSSPGIPESFNVLVKELQSLALDVELISNRKKPIPPFQN